MPTISAVINTRNEEHNIRYCLETLKWCDEIIVVDMESEDRTIEIVQEYTDKIYMHKKVLAFDIARKYAVNMAHSEWILLIDADEIVPRELAEKLQEIAQKNLSDAVQIPFKNYLFGEWNKFTGWWPDHHCRFFKKEVMDFNERIHSYQHLHQNASVITLPPEEEYAIHHFAYRDAAQFLNKMNRYTSIEAKHLSDDMVKFSVVTMFRSATKEFIQRYFLWKGYKDGIRGLFVSLMMVFYRLVSQIKLWEYQQFPNESVSDIYDDLKKKLIESYKNS